MCTHVQPVVDLVQALENDYAAHVNGLAEVDKTIRLLKLKAKYGIYANVAGPFFNVMHAELHNNNNNHHHAHADKGAHPSALRSDPRRSSLAAIRAHCRPGRAGCTTVEKAIARTRKHMTNPSPLIGSYSPAEIEWFLQRIRDMPTIKWAKTHHAAVA